MGFRMRVHRAVAQKPHLNAYSKFPECVPVTCCVCKESERAKKDYTYMDMYTYICTSVLLCISMHTESGYDSEVDLIVQLIWSKVCITISITISITNLTTIVA